MRTSVPACRSRNAVSASSASPTPRAQHDERAKELFSHIRVLRDFLGAMGILAPGANLRIHPWGTEWIRTVAPTTPATASLRYSRGLTDKTWLLLGPHGQPRQLVLVEFQGGVDPQMDERLFRYAKLLRRDLERMGPGDAGEPYLADPPPWWVYTGSLALGRGICDCPSLARTGRWRPGTRSSCCPVAHCQAGDFAADNLLSAIIPLEQCRMRLQAGDGLPTLTQARALTPHAVPAGGGGSGVAAAPGDVVQLSVLRPMPAIWV